MKVNVTVNGMRCDVEAPPLKRLLDVLREDLHLTGTKEGCGEGECGACSVRVNGELVNSCLVAIGQCEDAHILTVEGLSPAPEMLSGLQQHFVEAGAAQCGICTPGMLLAAHDLLERNAAPSREAIRRAIAGNLCRCTGYQKIVDAIALEAERRSRTAAR
jgi:carbon-monoxide dehydrogenase small subunit